MNIISHVLVDDETRLAWTTGDKIPCAFFILGQRKMILILSDDYSDQKDRAQFDHGLLVRHFIDGGGAELLRTMMTSPGVMLISSWLRASNG